MTTPIITSAEEATQRLTEWRVNDGGVPTDEGPKGCWQRTPAGRFSMPTATWALSHSTVKSSSKTNTSRANRYTTPRTAWTDAGIIRRQTADYLPGQSQHHVERWPGTGPVFLHQFAPRPPEYGTKDERDQDGVV